MSTVTETPDLLQSVREALEGITPLPWTADEQEMYIFARGTMMSGFETMVADSDYSRFVAEMRGFGSDEPQERNLHAIATVMNAAPALLSRVEAREAELLRLNGPTCPHDGKRASEHREMKTTCFAVHHDFTGDGESCSQILSSTYGRCSRYRDAYVHQNCQAHTPWSDGEKWLRENAR